MKIGSIAFVPCKQAKTGVKNTQNLNQNIKNNSINAFSNYSKAGIKVAFTGTYNWHDYSMIEQEREHREELYIGLPQELIKANRQARKEVYDALCAKLDLGYLKNRETLENTTRKVKYYNKDFALELINDGIVLLDEVCGYISLDHANTKSIKTIEARKEVYEALKQSGHNFKKGNPKSCYFAVYDIVRYSEEANKDFAVKLIKENKMPLEKIAEAICLSAELVEEEKEAVIANRMANL